jgi:indolepyruvate ferredoxin oxidoreductase beta subunit
MAVTNVLIAGVGGQGAILASELLALAAIAAGNDAKQGEFHGVAQRGGAVFSHVRFGERVYSKVEPIRIADQRPYPDEAIDFLKSKGFDVVVVNASETAIELGNHRAANVVLLGALAEYLAIPEEVWHKTMQERIPARLLSLNQQAFAAGRSS